MRCPRTYEVQMARFADAGNDDAATEAAVGDPTARVLSFSRLFLVVAVAVASRAASAALVALATATGRPVWPLLTADQGAVTAWDGQWYRAIAANGYHALPLQ